jgi:hypothetical protein
MMGRLEFGYSRVILWRERYSCFFISHPVSSKSVFILKISFVSCCFDTFPVSRWIYAQVAEAICAECRGYMLRRRGYMLRRRGYMLNCEAICWVAEAICTKFQRLYAELQRLYAELQRLYAELQRLYAELQRLYAWIAEAICSVQ